MHGALMISIAPFDGHAGPVLFCVGAGIIFVRVPEYAVASLGNLDSVPVIAFPSARSRQGDESLRAAQTDRLACGASRRVA